LAQVRFDEALSGFRQTNNTWGVIRTLQHAASLARTNGELSLAVERYRESLSLAFAQEDDRMVASALVGLATIASQRGWHDRVACLLGAADAQRERLGSPLVSVPLDRAEHERVARFSRDALGDEAFDAAWTIGNAWSLSEAVAQALVPFDERPSLNAYDAQAAAAAAAMVLGFTERERDVLPLLVAGVSDREIALTLGITRRTVQGHVSSIFRKLGVRTRTMAARAVISAGLVVPDDGGSRG
jgi:DNA-binding CsgD family transcriptional regulator